MAFRTTPLVGVILVLLVWPTAARSAEARRLRVLSYNVHHGEGIDQRIDLERIAQVIREAEPDLVALQEVDQRTERTHQVDQPAVFAELTGMEVVFGPNIAHQGGLYGNAVLSRLPIVSHKNYPLPVCYDGEQRGVMEVELQLPGGESLVLMATHLDYRRQSQERVLSAWKINSLVADRSDVPTLLAGDMNDVAGSCTLQILSGEWQKANRSVMPTFPEHWPHKQIDYVLSRPRGRWKTIETRVLSGNSASDHRPYLAVLELQGT